MKSVITAGLSFFLLPTMATADGSLFTTAQADAGEAVYQAHCVSCHGQALESPTAPDLKGPAFASVWGRDDRSLESLYYITRTTMPRDAGNSLSEEEYLNVIAFILRENGYPGGDNELKADRPAMSEIRLSGLAGVASMADKPAPAYIEGEGGLDPVGRGPSQEELLAAAGNTRDWLYQTRDYRGQRHAPIDQIDKGNVGALQPVCLYQLGGDGTFQSNPVVHDGVMYVTTYRLTVAIDARSCRQKWRHEWQAQDDELWKNNRGVAIKDGRVFRGSADGYLFALDVADGRLLWARQVADPKLGETFTMAPMAFEDLVLIGPAGSENNVSGWVGAFDARDGREVWRFKTVPGAKDPAEGDTWPNPQDIPLGGGAVWTPFSLDVNKAELYVAVTNPAPDLPAHLRPGPNLYTNSIVALNVRTGALRWYRQLVPNDAHDWDLTQVSPLLRLTIDGQERALVTTVGKDGILRPIDRETHEVLWETEVTTQKNVDLPLTTEGVLVCPGVLGGVEWNGPAWDPRTRSLFVNAVDWCSTFSLSDEEIMFVPGELYIGGEIEMESESRGWLSAMDAETGRVRWRYESDRPLLAAGITTSGGLVFTGELNGSFLALDADTGKELYRFNTGGPIGGGIVTYAIEGRQYVATVSGNASMWFGPEGAPTVVVFALPETE
jgi:alcohol dehydrogenase (cytochrome c)